MDAKGIMSIALIFVSTIYGQCSYFTCNSGTVAYAEVNNVKKEYSADVKLIARVTECEAGTEDDYGKRLVIDTILNRVDHDNFPDTVTGVVYQKNQFSVVNNGALSKTSADTDICDMVEEELEERTNSEVLFFQMGGYSDWGEHLFKHGNHYFCGE